MFLLQKTWRRKDDCTMVSQGGGGFMPRIRNQD